MFKLADTAKALGLAAIAAGLSIAALSAGAAAEERPT